MIFSNDQGPTAGSRLRFVNTSRGNLTFDWVVFLLPPTLRAHVGRVYDSGDAAGVPMGSEETAGDFGAGWRMVPGDRILASPGEPRLRLYRDDGTERDCLPREGGDYLCADDGEEGPIRISPTPDGGLVATLDGGLTRTFSPSGSGGMFRLSEIRSPEGDWAHLTYRDDRLVLLEDSGDGRIEVIHEELDGTRPGLVRVTELRDETGRAVRLRYGTGGELIEAATFRAGGFLLDYDEVGRLSRLASIHDGDLLRARYGPEGRLEHLDTPERGYRFHSDEARGTTEMETGDGLRHDASWVRGDTAMPLRTPTVAPPRPPP